MAYIYFQRIIGFK